MRYFVRQAAYEGRVCAFNQYYKSKSCDEIVKLLSEELIVGGNIYVVIQGYMIYKNKHLKIFEKEYESNFCDYRDEDIEEKEKYINEKLGKLPIHQLIKQIKIIELLWDFDVVSLYPSAIYLYPLFVVYSSNKS